MKPKTIQAIIINTDEKTLYSANIKNDLKTFYAVLKCSCITIVTRNFNGQAIDIICDDEGLLDHEKASRTAIITTDKKGKTVLEQIVGNCILCGHDDEGEAVSLTDKQMKAVSNCLFQFHNGQLGLIASI